MVELVRAGHDYYQVVDHYPVSLVLNLQRALSMVVRLDLLALAEAVEVGVLCGIDLSLGGKGRVMHLYRDALLGPERSRGRKPMSDEALRFFSEGLVGPDGRPLVPVVRGGYNAG